VHFDIQTDERRDASEEWLLGVASADEEVDPGKSGGDDAVVNC
jgi:hypothetical protein